MVLRDFMGDGRSDILWRAADGRLALWDVEGDGVPRFVALPQVSDQRYHPNSAGDYDANGSLDLVWSVVTFYPGAWGGFGAWFFEGGLPVIFRPLVADTSGGLPGAQLLTGFPFFPLRADGADFNGDGRSDFVVVSIDFGPSERIGIYTLDAAGVPATVALLDYPSDFFAAAFADFNGDGTTDILWRNLTTDEIGIWTMRGGAPVAWHSFGAAPPTHDPIRSGDIDGNGQADIIWVGATADGGINVGAWLLRGPEYAAEWRDFGTVYGDWEIVGTGDYTGDRSDDLLWRNLTTGENLIWDIDGGTVTRGIALPQVGTDWTTG